jgi:hypothetical protein
MLAHFATNFVYSYLDSRQMCVNETRLHSVIPWAYECLSKSFRTGRRLERELQMVQLSATTCSCIAILWVSLVSFAAVIFCVASRRLFVVCFVFDSVRKLLDTFLYVTILLFSVIALYSSVTVFKFCKQLKHALLTDNEYLALELQRSPQCKLCRIY